MTEEQMEQLREWARNELEIDMPEEKLEELRNKLHKMDVDHELKGHKSVSEDEALAITKASFALAYVLSYYFIEEAEK